MFRNSIAPWGDLQVSNIWELVSGYLEDFKNGIVEYNLKEDDETFELQMSCPGLKKENINIDMEGKNLLVSYKGIETRENEKGKFLVKGFDCDSGFEVSYKIPNQVDTSKIDANYLDGILFITLPKTKESKTKNKKIKVN
jgi:HSP20 family protein